MKLPRSPQRGSHQALQLNPRGSQPQWKAEVSTQGRLGPFKLESCSCQEHGGKGAGGGPEKSNMFWWLSKHPRLLIQPIAVLWTFTFLAEICFFQPIQFKDNPPQLCTVLCVKHPLFVITQMPPYHQSIRSKRPWQLCSANCPIKTKRRALPASSQLFSKATGLLFPVVCTVSIQVLSHHPSSSEF